MLYLLQCSDKQRGELIERQRTRFLSVPNSLLKLSFKLDCGIRVVDTVTSKVSNAFVD